MTAFEAKTENALNEGRILILGAQVLIGSGFQTVFTPRFTHLPPTLQTLRMAALISLLVSLSLLVLPVPFHWIAENNSVTRRFQSVVNRMLLLGLLPFVMGLGVDVQTVAWGVATPTGSLALAGGTGLLAVGLWYGLGITQRQPMRLQDRDERRPSLRERIKDLLIEARMVLPGAQALLGFQVASTLTDAFNELSATAKLIHLVSFLCVAMTVILLMTPAAYHRIALQGNDSESFYKLSCRFVLLALATLGLGLSSDLWIIVLRITGSSVAATGLASLMLVFFYALWFGYSYWRRHRP